MVLKNTLLTPALHVICEKPFLNFVLDLVDIVGFPGSSAAREPACSAGVPGSIPRSVRSPAEGIGYPLQHSWASLLGSAGKEPACSAGVPGLIPRSVRSPGEGDLISTHSSILGLPYLAQLVENPPAVWETWVQ